MPRAYIDGYRLPLLLIAGFRRLIDDLHTRLSEEGFPEMRPSYGFALQAIGHGGASPGEVAQRLGVSKQAAGKTIDALERNGLAIRRADPTNKRQKRVQLTDRGETILVRSAEIFDELVGEWAGIVGKNHIDAMIDDLHRVTGPTRLLDIPAWLDER